MPSHGSLTHHCKDTVLFVMLIRVKTKIGMCRIDESNSAQLWNCLIIQCCSCFSPFLFIKQENKDNKVDQVLIMDPSLVYRPDISDEEKKFLGLTDLSPDMDFTPGKKEAEFRRFDVS